MLLANKILCRMCAITFLPNFIACFFVWLNIKTLFTNLNNNSENKRKKCENSRLQSNSHRKKLCRHDAAEKVFVGTRVNKHSQTTF